jgi:hypothetical protein
MINQIAQQNRQVTGDVRHPGSQWIEEHWAELPENEWVAADASGKVAGDASIDNLMDTLKNLNIASKDVAIAFITSESAPLRLASHPFSHVAGTYEGEAWEELLEAIEQNRNQDEDDVMAEYPNVPT